VSEWKILWLKFYCFFAEMAKMEAIFFMFGFLPFKLQIAATVIRDSFIFISLSAV
jgi:hypothetical protein